MAFRIWWQNACSLSKPMVCCNIILTLLSVIQDSKERYTAWGDYLIDLGIFFYLNPGGLVMEGVYRVNGGQLTMKKLRTSFDQGKLYVNIHFHCEVLFLLLLGIKFSFVHIRTLRVQLYGGTDFFSQTLVACC